MMFLYPFYLSWPQALREVLLLLLRTKSWPSSLVQKATPTGSLPGLFAPICFICCLLIHSMYIQWLRAQALESDYLGLNLVSLMCLGNNGPPGALISFSVE